MIAHINIGSNLGNRAEIISRAVSLIDRHLGKVSSLSRPIESMPWGYDSPNPFLNIGANVETDLHADSILSILKKIEQIIAPGERHRNASGKYTDRTIDLDLICLGSFTCDNHWLTLPHPRMAQREFVLLPLAEILPDWIHPTLNLSVKEMIDALYNKNTPTTVNNKTLQQ